MFSEHLVIGSGWGGDYRDSMLLLYVDPDGEIIRTRKGLWIILLDHITVSLFMSKSSKLTVLSYSF